MQRQPYFVIVLAHSLHGRLRRIHIPHAAIYSVLIFALIGCLASVAVLSSYVRMTWKVANYNSLRHQIDSLRDKYQELQRVTKQKNEQLASLQLFASEVTVAYGLKRNTEAPAAAMVTHDARLMPTYRETLNEYSFLQTASGSSMFRQYPKQWQVNIRPSLWPVNGRLMSPFGSRTDPFSGEGAMHTGVDLSASMGTPVKATADGVVEHAAWSSSYGNLIVIDHGNGMETYYGHLSRYQVVPGEEVRRGDIIAFSGATGRVTAPHLHYEVRMRGTPVNPYPYLARSAAEESTASKDLLF